MAMTLTIKPSPTSITEGGVVTLTASPRRPASTKLFFAWSPGAGRLEESGDDAFAATVHWDTTGLRAGSYPITARSYGSLDDAKQGIRPLDDGALEMIVDPRPLSSGDTLAVSLRRAATQPTNDLALWVIIRQSTDTLAFNNYQRLVDTVLCGPTPPSEAQAATVGTRLDWLKRRRFLPFTDSDAYRVLKAATEAFVSVSCGVFARDHVFLDEDLRDLMRRMELGAEPGLLDRLWSRYLVKVVGSENVTIPYLALVRQKLGLRDVRRVPALDSLVAEENAAGLCLDLLEEKRLQPCLLELIWSYWHEEGMLVQAINAITRRFQNMRGAEGRDPLAQLEIDPLRPLNNLLWGYTQDEQHRLSIRRRAYEYDHHYGLTLEGRAVPPLQPADSRSRFIEGFHGLLGACAEFYRRADDTTVIPDGFPVLNALREVHLLLSEGAHNQFGDLPATARAEMLMQQWLLARPEFREFLPSRVMVAYPEPWMDRVDTMKRLQGWSDVNVLHFRNLGVYGEQILLSIRFGAWSDVRDPLQAANWARFWRAEVQGYVHAYRAVRGVDLVTASVNLAPQLPRFRDRVAQRRLETR